MTDDSRYDSAVDLTVKNNAHTLAYELICHRGPSRRLRVLDVGCASGLFGAALRRAGHEVWGVERSAQGLAARDRLDHVFIGSVEEFLRSAEAATERFDVISFIDVLEHLVDPAGALERCVALLGPDGAIVASLPNVAHLAVRVMLLEGRWEYADLGLLDRTHLRFFTRESIVDLLDGAGLAVEEMRTVVVPVAQAGISVDPRLLRRASRLVRDADAEIFQYVLRARPMARAAPAPAPAPVAASVSRRSPKVLCVEAQPGWSIGEIRFRAPLEAWSARGRGEFRLITVGALDHRQMRWADIVVFQREAPAPLVELASDLRRLGRRVVFELDDLLTQVPPFLASHAHSVASRPDLERMIRLADAVTVTTPRLQRKLSRLNPRVLVVPNCSAPTLVTARHDGGPVTLLVASSDTVRVDFLTGALAALCADPAWPVRVVAVGPPGDTLARASVPAECHPLMSHEEFKLFVASLDDAVGLIPLDGSEFSGCKSAIKFVDYALAGVPSICSAVPPYTDVVADGVTGRLVANTDADWRDAIRELIVSAPARRRLAAAARAMCLERFNVQVAADAWDDVFTRVLDDASPARSAAGSSLGRLARPLRALQPALRRVARPSCYVNGLRIARREGIAGLVSRLRLYLGGG